MSMFSLLFYAFTLLSIHFHEIRSFFRPLMEINGFSVSTHPFHTFALNTNTLTFNEKKIEKKKYFHIYSDKFDFFFFFKFLIFSFGFVGIIFHMRMKICRQQH